MTDELAYTLDRGSSSQPLWSQVLDDLRRRVVEREFVEIVPGELALSAQYQVSRHTIREALRVLRSDGTVIASRGRSSLVSVKEHRPRGAVHHFAAALEAGGFRYRSVVSSVGIRVDGRIAARLGREQSQRLLRVERLHLVGDAAVAVDRAWLPEDLAEPLLDADLTAVLIDDHYAHLCGIIVTGGREQILPVLPAASERSMLDIGRGVAVYAVEQLGEAGGHPVEWRRTLLRSDWFSITAELSGRDGYRLVPGTEPTMDRVATSTTECQSADGSSKPSSRAVS